MHLRCASCAKGAGRSTFLVSTMTQAKVGDWCIDVLSLWSLLRGIWERTQLFDWMVSTHCGWWTASTLLRFSTLTVTFSVSISLSPLALLLHTAPGASFTTSLSCLPREVEEAEEHLRESLGSLRFVQVEQESRSEAGEVVEGAESGESEWLLE